MRRFVEFITFTVQGRGPFPVDMLRYDECWPIDADSVSTIAAASPGALSQSDPSHLARRRVRLTTIRPDGPSVGRWDSFGWRMLLVEGE